MLSVFGGVTYSYCLTLSSTTGVSPDCSGNAFLLVVGLILLIPGIVLIVAGRANRPTVIRSVADPSVPPPIIRPVVIPQTIERNPVPVRCPYCGSQYDSSRRECPSCGAPHP